MIDPDKLPDAAVDANDSHIDSRKGLAAAIEALLADDEVMMRARKALIADMTKPLDSMMANVVLTHGIRAALTAAVQEER